MQIQMEFMLSGRTGKGNRGSCRKGICKMKICRQKTGLFNHTETPKLKDSAIKGNLLVI